MARILLSLLFLVMLPVSSICAAESPVKPQIRVGLMPIFVDDQAAFINSWHDYLESHLGRPVTFVQRGSYREIVDMLREGKLDFAWLCGYPYVRNKAYLRLVAVPLYKGKPLYRSYLIVPSSDRQTKSLKEMRGKIFVFADPDSNSGYLYPEYLLATEGEKSFTFFDRTFYTWSHRKVIEAVAIGLAQGGAVDGYIWDTLAQTNPELTGQTRILLKSPELGFPPIVAGLAARSEAVAAMQQMLLGMALDKDGSRLLKELNLDGFVRGDRHLYDEIDRMSRFVEKSRMNVLQKH